jgi:ATPase subunit of ABC transporter with duplicated ATPase domains
VCSAWVRNTDLHELDPKTVLDEVPAKMTKALEAAYHLAAQENSLDHYKEILQAHQEERLRQEEEDKQKALAAEEANKAKESAKAAKAQATPAKMSHKKKAKAEDDDVEMADADEEEGSETTKKSKKRKADGSAEVCFASGQACFATHGPLVLTSNRPRSGQTR